MPTIAEQLSAYVRLRQRQPKRGFCRHLGPAGPKWRRSFKQGSEVYHRLEDWRNTRTETPPNYDYLHEHRAIIGTPEQCVAKINDLQQQGIEYFGCNFSFGGMEHSKLLRSMKLFADEVMPHFQ